MVRAWTCLLESQQRGRIGPRRAPRRQAAGERGRKREHRRHYQVGNRSTYLYIMVLIIALLAYIQAMKLWGSFYSSLDVGRAIFGGVFFLFILLGNVLGRVRRNFYIGVRTPWTLASEKVWDATHRFSGRVMVLAGLLGLLSLVVFKGGVAGLVIICGAALASILYSLVCYKRLERRNQL
jgi:uncharacterized membrane protein